MRKVVLIMFILFVLNGYLTAQEPDWLTKIKQIDLLKSTEKDVEKIFGKLTERYSTYSEYVLEDGRLSFKYSQGKCSLNEDSEYDVEKGTVVAIYFQTPKQIKFNSLNVNLNGFKKEYSSDAAGAYAFENKQLGIRYSIGNGFLNAVFITPAENYAYLVCQKKPKQPEPVIDDVGQEFFNKLTQLKVLEQTRSDVAVLFGTPFKSRNEEYDFYLEQKYGFGFTYSTGMCSLLNEDIWNVSKGKLIKIVAIFDKNGIALTLDLGKLNKKEEKDGFIFYEDKEQGIEYKIKNARIWRIEYFPARKYNGLRCIGQ